MQCANRQKHVPDLNGGGQRHSSFKTLVQSTSISSNPASNCDQLLRASIIGVSGQSREEISLAVSPNSVMVGPAWPRAPLNAG